MVMLMWFECRNCIQKQREGKFSKDILFRSFRPYAVCFWCWLDEHPTPVRTTRGKALHEIPKPKGGRDAEERGGYRAPVKAGQRERKARR